MRPPSVAPGLPHPAPERADDTWELWPTFDQYLCDGGLASEILINCPRWGREPWSVPASPASREAEGREEEPQLQTLTTGAGGAPAQLVKWS